MLTGSGIEVVITGLTRNRVGQAPGCRRDALIPLDFLKYLRFSTVSFLRIFYVFSTFSTRDPLTSVDGQSVGNTAWRRIEVVVTRLTRNQLTGQTVRGFESLRLRHRDCGDFSPQSFFILWMPPCAGTSRSSPPRIAPGPRSPGGHRCRR